MRDHLLAAFVGLHLVAVTLHALPSAGGAMNRAAWRDPTVQGEFATWAERLTRWGWPVTVPELEEHLWSLAVGSEAVRQTVLAPFDPYYRYAGTWQSWRMFVAPHRYPGRLEIRVDRGQGFEPLYVARSDEHGWRRAWFDHDRMRAAVFRYGWKHYKTARLEFADWVAEQVAADHPDVRRVEVSFVRYRTRSPEEVRQGIAAQERRELKNYRTVPVDP
jgi:hypothetical protein